MAENSVQVETYCNENDRDNDRNYNRDHIGHTLF